MYILKCSLVHATTYCDCMQLLIHANGVYLYTLDSFTTDTTVVLFAIIVSGIHTITQVYSVYVILGWLFGDPHIRTLDGLSYTFNGLGEYVLLETADGNFTLQGRTARALSDNGTETRGTIFSGFAAQDAASDIVHVQMNNNRDGKRVTLLSSVHISPCLYVA